MDAFEISFNLIQFLPSIPFGMGGGEISIHSMAMRNLTKVWKTETVHSQDDRALSTGPKSALFELLQNRDYCYYTYLVVRL